MRPGYPIKDKLEKSQSRILNHPKLKNKTNNNKKMMNKSDIKIKWNKTMRDKIKKIK